MDYIGYKHNNSIIDDEQKGQTVDPKLSIDDLPKGSIMRFDNNGNIVVMNRAARRKRARLAPKSSQLRKKGKRKKK